MNGEMQEKADFAVGFFCDESTGRFALWHEGGGQHHEALARGIPSPSPLCRFTRSMALMRLLAILFSLHCKRLADPCVSGELY